MSPRAMARAAVPCPCPLSRAGEEGGQRETRQELGRHEPRTFSSAAFRPAGRTSPRCRRAGFSAGWRPAAPSGCSPAARWTPAPPAPGASDRRPGGERPVSGPGGTGPARALPAVCPEGQGTLRCHFNAQRTALWSFIALISPRPWESPVECELGLSGSTGPGPDPPSAGPHSLSNAMSRLVCGCPTEERTVSYGSIYARSHQGCQETLHSSV